jgi:hypothetical protein
MTEVTRLLSAIENGDPRAGEQLLPLVYEELRKLADGRRVELVVARRHGPVTQAAAKPIRRTVLT